MMFSTSVWNLSDFWKSVERASIYLMMFLAVAILFLPLVQPEEAKAPITIVGATIIAAVIIGGSAIAAAIIQNSGNYYDCGGCSARLHSSQTHWSTTPCPGKCGNHYYTCNPHDDNVCVKGHVYYKCNLEEVAYHQVCDASGNSSDDK